MATDDSETALDVTSDDLAIDRSAGVGRIVMDRPERHNAMSEAMASDLRDAIIELIDEDDVRALVLTGTGDAFNTGADLEALHGDETDGRRLRAVATRLHSAIHHLATAPKPVVAGVNGAAAGGGFGLAMCCDVVLAATDAEFTFSYPRIGLSGDGGSTFLLPRLVGLRRAREIAMLDRAVDAEAAVEMGLATETVDPDAFEDRLAELAADLATGPTRAHGATKRLMLASYGRGLDDQLDAETDTIERLAGTDDYARGYEAFFDDEDPSFEGH
ncbi:enoyl-CoA hydratase [Halobacteriales archaeon SW_7_68_16]|nr:MAG: enoyl-CoA hydratase [Halobacteriales archaeon SW_7_68_16]